MSCWRHSFAFHSLQLQKSSGRKKSPQQQDNNICAFGRAQFSTKHFSMSISPFHRLPECGPRYIGIFWKFEALSRWLSSNVKMIQLKLVTGHWASHLSMNTTLGRSLWVMWWHCHQGIFHWLTFLNKYVKSHSWKGFIIRRRFNKEIDDNHVWKSPGHVASKQLVLFCTIYLCNFPLPGHQNYWKKYS